MERLKSLASHLMPGGRPPHPSDPLTAAEIEKAVDILRREKQSSMEGSEMAFNTVGLWEPRKAEMLNWLETADDVEAKKTLRPTRIADCIVIGKGSKVFDALVDLNQGVVVAWRETEGVQPLITMEDLKQVELVCRTDREVIRQCGILGIPPEDMHKVYCDPWTIGYDERFGSSIRLQQALMYYRPHLDDSQYTYPLDFCPIYDADNQRIIHIDVPTVRRPLNAAPPSNYDAYSQAATKTDDGKHDKNGLRTDLKPLNITQPQGVSFAMNGREISWLNWKLHIGFNHREGIVLNNISFRDRDQGNRERPVIWRLSLAEMVVPYGNPEHPHHRKHAFDLGEYGGGYMTNELALGCDCKGAIHYLPFDFVTRSGAAATIKNAVCIHEEDGGILFKHTDFRDDSCTLTRARKLVISHVFTAANYEYCVYWILHMDGTIQLEIKLTGILNTYALGPDEDPAPWGTRVYPGVNAHSHEHLFCLRIDPQIDGQKNSVFQSDAVSAAAPVGSAENKHGNAFFCKKTRFETQGQGFADYDGSTSRTWDLANESVRNRYSGAPVAYKLVSREIPSLLPKEDSLVWRRAAFARHAIHVTRYADDQLHPAGRHVPQTSGAPNPHNATLPDWIAAAPDAPIADADVVLWHTFGVVHFPSPEDFPLMPAEPMGVALRPRHFFARNPALDVRPSVSVRPSQVAKGERGFREADGFSRGV